MPDNPTKTIDDVLISLATIGRITKPQQECQHAPISEQERINLARILGQAIEKPLSEFIIEERGI